MRSLTARARHLFPTKRNAAKWVLSVRYLRANRLWLLEGGKPRIVIKLKEAA